ncbi:MAG: hypothetical protein JWO94_3693 [Verrucomicrobiaceae bacterium]|nr:hypothetical protein [Verrucomicrobiaceae bacterium]
MQELTRAGRSFFWALPGFAGLLAAFWMWQERQPMMHSRTVETRLRVQYLGTRLGHLPGVRRYLLEKLPAAGEWEGVQVAAALKQGYANEGGEADLWVASADLERGLVDCWHAPLHFRRLEAAANGGAGVIIWSEGLNHINDHGGGDDIAVRVMEGKPLGE